MERSNTNLELNAAEWSQLWAAYMNASIGSNVLKTFLQHIEDDAIKHVIVETRAFLQGNLKRLEGFFKQADHPLPLAFTEEDINVEAPRLYTDDYYLLYMTQIGAFGMMAHTHATIMSMREDVREFFSDRAHIFDQLNDQAVTLALQKGIYPKPPTIPVTKDVDFVEKQSFMTGWFGDKRPLTALEIAYLNDNLQRNQFGIATLMGFSQVAQSDDVRDYIVRGLDIAKKHVNVFQSVLEEENIPVAMGADAMVTDEHKASPYSDKLMMNIVTELIVISVTFYGMALTTYTRKDLAAHYMRLVGEILKYAEDGATLLIQKGWMEEPPKMVDRDQLINQNKKGD
ncbi:DUF3231 family protein [Lentibacillus saliphilus]|uniref:DUF3231 family protein n=1 Tax=Lentibacillus saliphilus TaxID=2737028 RepID=UPI001C30A7F7|nr:DUF3231 family protein [Lentibacillus saliphilus]